MATNVLTNAGPILRTQLPGPNARRILEADKKYISPSYTRSYPLVAKRGRGIMVEDVDGNEFIDFAAGIAVTSTGHCHPEVVAAIQKQAGGADPHFRHRFLLRKLADACRAAFGVAPDDRAASLLLRQLRSGSRRVRR